MGRYPRFQVWIQHNSSKKSGDRMGGDLDMDSHFIKNVGINLSDDTTVVPRSYVDSFANTTVLNPLTTDLVMNNFQIKQLKTPTEDKYAINKKYFEDELLRSHLIPSHRENAFKYLLDQDESSSERNIMVMNMNGHSINTPFFVTGYYHKSQSYNRIFLNNLSSYQIIPFHCILNEIVAYFGSVHASNYQVSLWLYITGKSNINHGEKQHYCLIKSLSRLLSSQMSKT